MAGLKAVPAGAPAGHTKATSAPFCFHKHPQLQMVHIAPMSTVKGQGPKEQLPGMGALAACPWLKARMGIQTGLLNHPMAPDLKCYTIY